MPLPEYAKAQIRAEKQASARLPADGEPDPVAAPASPVDAAPSGVPPFAAFRLAGRVAPFVVLVAVSGVMP